MLFNCEKRSGKRFQMICEKIAELELQIEFAQKFDLEYKDLLQKKQSLERELDGGNNRETRKKENKNKKRRLF